jgi:hypothetical protein
MSLELLRSYGVSVWHVQVHDHNVRLQFLSHQHGRRKIGGLSYDGNLRMSSDKAPVAATVGLLFWGWLWGIAGLLLAVPLTAFLKLLADSEPSLVHLSNLLARQPHRFLVWRKRSHPGSDALLDIS